MIEYQANAGDIKVSLRPGQTKTFGRNSKAEQVVTGDPCISGLHFSIQCDSRCAYARDLEGSNGTFLNGQRIEESELQDGDQFIVGMTVFTVRYSYQ